ncbi:PQQ-dependent sugar dehydrogenase [Paenisporosarcina sp. FSL H8-0542]|uniref:PQQ-dependent sugar dehydrogenase n=1 Tax=Paenisporosarcina sp. FSL H8-0542 TaxID=2921401 RepID=UPI00315B318C
MKRWVIFTSCLLLLSGCGIFEQNNSEEPELIKEVAKNLQVPWSINQSGKDFYISERVGTIAYIQADGTVEHQKVDFTTPLATVSEAGLLGFVLKPTFEETKTAFAYYNYDAGNGPFNRIVTLKLEGEVWKETAIHLDEISTGNVHHGGRLEIGPDQLLYATIGDASNPQLAQDPDSKNGKIIRLNANNQWETVSLGHRNPQGLAWSDDGVLFASEHGQSANDEINKIEPGSNYGWPLIEGSEEREGYVTPWLHSGANVTWAPSGMAFHKGKLYVAALRGEGILVINPESGELEDKITGYGRIRDVFSNGEELYFVSNNRDGRGKANVDDDKLYQYLAE